MSGTHYDVVVIGGGIQGTGVAQAAAAEGYSVLLLEKTALAAGTSSKSSKLIHGGLRYLESAELSLVRESLTERAILLKIAPDLVKMRRFVIPVYRGMRRAAWQINVGLKLYYTLANFRSQAKGGKIPRRDWDKLDGLTTDQLRAVFYYADAQTDDKKLTQAVMASAQSLGAELLMPAEFLSATSHDESNEIVYSHNGKEHTCTGRVLVNAGGPWVNTIAKRITPRPLIQNIDLIGGTHIILDGSVNENIYYTESPRDGRAVFIMPWYGQLMVGTTERVFRGRPEQLKPTLAEKKYLLAVLARYFPAYRSRTVKDISDAWSGLRVLPTGEGHAFHRSREVSYRVDKKPKPSVLSIYGGKLTVYRETAQQVMGRIRPSLPNRKRRGDTSKLPLTPVD